MSGLSHKKFPIRGEQKLQFFLFFENEVNPHILTPGQLKYINSLIWIENGYMSELSQKSSPAPWSAKTSIFSIFWKVFENEENPHILTPEQLNYTNLLIWMENGNMSELSQKSSPDPRKLQFFGFFEKFSKMKKILIFSLQDNLNIQIHSFGWKMGTWANWAIKRSPGPRWPKTSIFLIFWKVLENEENPHILITGWLKYTNWLIWMENGYMSELSKKSSPGPRWAKTSIFSIFWKVLENEENPHILTPRQLKYTNSLIWMENGHMSELSQKRSQAPRGEWGGLQFFYDF